MANTTPNHTISSLFRDTGFFDKAALVSSTWFFLGFIPGAPGTYGTIGAIIPAFLLGHIAVLPRLAILVFMILLSILVSHKAMLIFHKTDPSQVVIDEVVGFLVATFAIPMAWTNLCLGFIFFRAFDILKPFPIKLLEKRLKGGLGIVADDLAAGIFALICVKLINHFFF